MYHTTSPNNLQTYTNVPISFSSLLPSPTFSLLNSKTAQDLQRWQPGKNISFSSKTQTNKIPHTQKTFLPSHFYQTRFWCNLKFMLCSWWWFQFPGDILWWIFMLEVSSFTENSSSTHVPMSLQHASNCNIRKLILLLYRHFKDLMMLPFPALKLKSFNRCVLMNLISLNIIHFDTEWKMKHTEKQMKLNLLCCFFRSRKWRR
jgi:hypothetical protein